MPRFRSLAWRWPTGLRRLRALGLALSCATACLLHAQSTTSLPPVHQLGARIAMSRDSLGRIAGIRELSDGRVIVNDVGKRRLLMYDSTLTRATVVVDSTSTGARKAYGPRGGGIIPYRGDTTIFVDPTAISFLVIDPRGTIARILAPPSDPAAVQTFPPGSLAFDARGRLIYLAPPARLLSQKVAVDSNPATLVRLDSAILARADMTTRLVDTAGFIVIGANPQGREVAARGSAPAYVLQMYDPIILFDWWAVTTDGSIAMVRGLDYHIDWINADGSRSSTPRMAHDWKRLTDSAKVAIIDSGKHITDSVQRVRKYTDSVARARTHDQSPPPEKVVMQFVDPSDLPDYMPPFVPGGVVADADNNVWIREGASYAMNPPAVYDIVNRQGRVIDRVQLPPGLLIGGFGHGAVFLTSNEGWGTVIVKYRIR